MSFEVAEFRRILGHLATGVTVVTARDAEGTPHGLTATAVASLSLRPPLVLACVEHTSDTHDCIERAGAFAVSILREDSEAMARRFADHPTGEKFDGVGHRDETTGAPVLADALAWVDCRLRSSHDGGDHTIYVGEVVAGGASEGGPLLHFRGGFGRVAP